MNHTEAEHYFASWIAAKCLSVLDEGELEYLLKQLGITEQDARAIKLNMIQLKDMPGYMTIEQQTEKLMNRIPEEA